ncbi:MAG: PilZ domain-containing protein [Alphaproteobacteria bacterium]|nr:PilZ domain-containing protein [Alphaproteobacteria bacterium]
MILTIRAHKRYSVRHAVELHGALDGGRRSGLIIELSREGCRISGVETSDLAPGDAVVVECEGTELPGRICWVHSGIVGVRLDRPLTARELNARLASLRGETVRQDAAVRDEPVARRRA